jgi:hypothetical protein
MCKSDLKTPKGGECALYWNESFIWGLMAESALRTAGLPFELVTSEDIRAGTLENFRMLYVPGGWAFQKILSLQDEGISAIRSFVRSGGSYVGICGGAGMATADGIGLLGITRKPASERVAGFSGRIRLDISGHQIWKGITDPVFTAAWPSQLQVENHGVEILARYGEAQPEAFSSDVNVADGRAIGWAQIEKLYGILLDPERLRGAPAVVEGKFGQGRVVLSLLHFDYPGDPNGAIVLRNLFGYIAPGYPPAKRGVTDEAGYTGPGAGLSAGVADLCSEIRAHIQRIISTGERNFLWHRRNSLLLQWRRGVRGLEYSTLAAIATGISQLLSSRDVVLPDSNYLERELSAIRDRLQPFADKAIRLLLKERIYLSERPLSPLHCRGNEISSLRRELFGTAMSHGGEFKALADAMDRILYKLMKSRKS